MYNDEIGFGYTIASGKLFCPMDVFHVYAEKLLGRPILTHEFGDARTWRQLRGAFEEAALKEIGDE
jgi:hypothetical protein